MSRIVTGRLALVTGAGSGIGRAACNILAREGAIVIGADRNKEAARATIDNLIKETSNVNHSYVGLDVSSNKTVLNVFSQILEKYKDPPTILVNSAGVTKDNFILKMSELDFEDVIDINLKGTFIMMQQFAKALVEAQKTGSIINIASIVGKIGNIGQCNYAASKSGVEAMTRVASKEFGKFGIRVNAILPGFIKSPMTNIIPDKVKGMIVAQCAMRRFGEPEEIAEVITFLASERSSYVNGASIEVTGG